MIYFEIYSYDVYNLYNLILTIGALNTVMLYLPLELSSEIPA